MFSLITAAGVLTGLLLARTKPIKNFEHMLRKSAWKAYRKVHMED